MKALIVTDLQNDFGSFGVQQIKGIQDILPIANQLIQSNYFDCIIASRYWYPANHPIFAANHYFRYPNQEIEINGHLQRLWAIHCVQESFGAAFIDELQIDKVDKIISKGTHIENVHYSAFNHKFPEESELNTYLKAASIHEVFIVGVATEFGVKQTALDAQALGFQTFVLEDACRAANLDHPNDGQLALQELQQANITLLDSDQLIL